MPAAGRITSPLHVFIELLTMDPLKLKEKFFADRDLIFHNEELLKDPFKFCVKWSLLVEEYIQKILHGQKLKCAIASVGSFSRRELSPCSDIHFVTRQWRHNSLGGNSTRNFFNDDESVCAF